MSSRFVYADDALALDEIDATLAGGGGARGSGRIDIGGAQSVRVSLDVRDLDLVRLHSKLVATRLSGQVRADATATRQVLEGDVRDRDIGLAFAAVIADERVEVSRFHATTPGGSLRGTARMAFNDTNAFTVDATMQRLDPSRFVAVSPASIDGSVGVRGVLRPRWRADANVTVASGSRIDGVPASGAIKGTVAPGTLRDATIDLMRASVSVHASGSAGTAGDRLTYTIDAPRIADIEALVPASIPRPLAGEAHASGVLALSPGTLGGNVDFRARALRAGEYSVQTLLGQASIAPPVAGSRTALGDRALALDITAMQLVLPARTIETAHATVTGPLSRHHATLELKAQDIDVALALDGALANVDQPALRTWNGTLASFVNRGAVPSGCARPRRSRCANAISRSPTLTSTPPPAPSTSASLRGTTDASRRAARFPASRWPTPPSSRRRTAARNDAGGRRSSRSPRHHG
jgi:autotransporter translocation and assembly factor TamB